MCKKSAFINSSSEEWPCLCFLHWNLRCFMEDYVAACKELEAFSLSYIILCAGQNTFYSCWKINLLSLPFLTYYNVLVIKSFLPLFLPVFIFTVLFSTICLCLTFAHDFINFALLLVQCVASEYICKITFQTSFTILLNI